MAGPPTSGLSGRVVKVNEQNATSVTGTLISPETDSVSAFLVNAVTAAGAVTVLDESAAPGVITLERIR